MVLWREVGVNGKFTASYALTPTVPGRLVLGELEVGSLTGLETVASVLMLVTDLDGVLWIFDP